MNTGLYIIYIMIYKHSSFSGNFHLSAAPMRLVIRVLVDVQKVVLP